MIRSTFDSIKFVWLYLDWPRRIFRLLQTGKKSEDRLGVKHRPFHESNWMHNCSLTYVYVSASISTFFCSSEFTFRRDKFDVWPDLIKLGRPGLICNLIRLVWSTFDQGLTSAPSFWLLKCCRSHGSWRWLDGMDKVGRLWLRCGH